MGGENELCVVSGAGVRVTPDRVDDPAGACGFGWLVGGRTIVSDMLAPFDVRDWPGGLICDECRRGFQPGDPISERFEGLNADGDHADRGGGLCAVRIGGDLVMIDREQAIEAAAKRLLEAWDDGMFEPAYEDYAALALALDQQPSVQQSYLARGCQQLPTHEVVLRCSIVAFDRGVAVENLLDALEDVAESVSLVPGLGTIVQEDES